VLHSLLVSDPARTRAAQLIFSPGGIVSAGCFSLTAITDTQAYPRYTTRLQRRETMLGWVITCHDDEAQKILGRLETKFGPLAQCQAVNYWRGLSTNMLSRMMCDALHQTDTGDGVIFLTDKS